MFLAVKEMRRSSARFGLLVGAIGLLVFLILFQQALQTALIGSFIGAIRSQTAPVLVFSVDGRRNLQGGVIPPPLEEQIRSVDGVEASGRIGQRSVPVTAGGELTRAAFIGYEVEGLGSPGTIASGRLPQGPGEVVASEANRADGFDLGQVVRVEPGGRELVVVGLAADAQLLVSPTLYGTYDTYAEAVRSANPDATQPLPSAIGLAPEPGVSAEDLVTRVNATAPEADALVKADAAEATPGVEQISQSFRIIFLLYGLVVPFVTGLFFLIITFQKAGALTLLRAIGAPARRLVSALLVQVVVVVLLGVGVGTALFAPLSRRSLGGLPLSFDPGAVAFWTVLLLALSILSSLFAARRVLAIEPVEATTGAGVRP